MTHGKSIRIFLAEGLPSGILTAEIVNWTGHVLSAPRSKLTALVKREECKKTGIYFLVSEGLEPPFYPNVYIGESDDVAKRLEQHNKDDDKGGKSFWEKVCLITSKDQNLTKAHIRYLETRLIEVAKQSGHCQLENGTEGFNNISLPEADISAMEYFLEQILVLLPVLGYDFLTSKKRQHMSIPSEGAICTSKEFARFCIKSEQLNVDAMAEDNDGEFTVLKGSRISSTVASSSKNSGYNKSLRPYLFEHGYIDLITHRFVDDYTFKSPSAAASIVLGRAANGRKEWKDVKSNLSYAELQEVEIKQAISESDE